MTAPEIAAPMRNGTGALSVTAPAAGDTPPAPQRSWTITLPRTASMVPVARAFTRCFLGAGPRSGDAELIMSEYAGNAVRYGRQGQDGIIHLTVTTTAATVRVEVTDPGPLPGPASPPQAPPAPAGLDEENGRGFLIVDALAARWGHYGTGGGQLTAWAEIEDVTR
jgi:anti-sigma regulatory factor (Ser/Thr protein kinase)